ncbi:MAG: AI-2E family transporter [Vampirovibrionales bacterium]|nr:AI-2E family transporter [Vampirovibrionales bacterium]
METGQTEPLSRLDGAGLPTWIMQLSWIALLVVLLTFGNLLKPVLALVLGVMATQAALQPLVDLSQHSLHRLLKLPLSWWPWLQHRIHVRLFAVLGVYIAFFLSLTILAASLLPTLIHDVERVSASLARLFDYSSPRHYRIVASIRPSAALLTTYQPPKGSFWTWSNPSQLNPLGFSSVMSASRIKLQPLPPDLRAQHKPWGAMTLFGSERSMNTLKKLGRIGAGVVVNASFQAGANIAALGFFAILGVVLVFYALLDPHLSSKLILGLMPVSEHQVHLIERMNRIFNRFVTSYVLLALLNTLVLFVSLTLAGVSEALVLSVTFGIFSMVPWLGFWLGLLPVWALAVGHVSWFNGLGILGILSLVWALRRWLLTQLLPPSLMRYPKKTMPFSAMCSVLGSFCLMQAYGLSGLLLSLPLSALIYAALEVRRTPYGRSGF